MLERHKFTFFHNVFKCIKLTASANSYLVFVMEKYCFYCEVRAEIFKYYILKFQSYRPCYVLSVAGNLPRARPGSEPVRVI